MFGIRRTIFIILLAALMSIVFISVCYANPAEPPSILIIVPDAPDDLDISIGSGDTHVKAKRRDKLIESYYISKNLFV